MLAALAVRENGSDEEKIVQAVSAYGADGMTFPRFAARFDEEEENMAKMLASLCARGKMVALADRLPCFVGAGRAVDGLRGDAAKIPPRASAAAGMRLAEARQRLFRGGTRQNAEAIFACFAREGKLKRTTEYCALADFSVRLTRRQRAIREEMLRPAARQGYSD
ncbi:MAG: hypothetical protein V8S72_03990 [Oscillospiraceae bacterium]